MLKNQTLLSFVLTNARRTILVNILMFGNSNHILTSLECKDHVKYLGVLQDSHSSWNYHIDNVALKIIRISLVRF